MECRCVFGSRLFREGVPVGSLRRYRPHGFRLRAGGGSGRAFAGRGFMPAGGAVAGLGFRLCGVADGVCGLRVAKRSSRRGCPGCTKVCEAAADCAGLIRRFGAAASAVCPFEAACFPRCGLSFAVRCKAENGAKSAAVRPAARGGRSDDTAEAMLRKRRRHERLPRSSRVERGRRRALSRRHASRGAGCLLRSGARRKTVLNPRRCGPLQGGGPTIRPKRCCGSDEGMNGCPGRGGVVPAARRCAKLRRIARV